MGITSLKVGVGVAICSGVGVTKIASHESLVYNTILPCILPSPMFPLFFVSCGSILSSFKFVVAIPRLPVISTLVPSSIPKTKLGFKYPEPPPPHESSLGSAAPAAPPYHPAPPPPPDDETLDLPNPPLN